MVFGYRHSKRRTYKLSSSTDDILADAAETAQRKIETITTPDDFTQYSEWGGFVDLEIGVRIPNSYYEAVKEYCNLAKIPVREWFNNEIILAIEALELGSVTKIFLDKYHLRELSSDKREAMVQAYRKFSLSEERLSDA
jgi:hypothetical protein